MPLTIAAQRIKYLGISWMKEVKELYFKNYKILIKEIKEDVINGKTVCVHTLEELIYFKCPH